VTPQEFGLAATTIDTLVAGDTAEENLAIADAVLNGEPGPAQDIVVLNTAATLAAAGIAETIGDGVPLARESLQSGAARDKLQALVELTNA
jgi:anthranilate phosphoribosyltransferase